VTGVPISLLLTRGQQVKVLTQMYRKAAQHNLLIPVRDKVVSDDKYEGATVLEPKCAFYDIPVCTAPCGGCWSLHVLLTCNHLCYRSQRSISRRCIRRL
jgi:DNA polymerase delta subunit 1